VTKTPGDPVGDVVTWSRRVVYGALVIIALFAAALYITYSVGASKDRKLTEATRVIREQRAQDEKDRIERSVGSCKQQNASFIADHNQLAAKDKANWSAIASLIEQLSRQPQSPQSHQFIDAIRSVAESYDENIIPVRDCTPKGIDAYQRGLGLGG
jgi:hypothetical protein